MMEWIIANTGNIAVVMLISGLLYICSRNVFTQKTCGCGRNCSTCALACRNKTMMKQR